MKANAWNHMTLFLHDVKSVEFEVHKGVGEHEILKIYFMNNSDPPNIGDITMFFKGKAEIKNLKILEKLKKITAKLGGIKLSKGGENAAAE